MIIEEKYKEAIECRVECQPISPSTISLVPDRWDTFYNGNPDFKLDLSNFNQEVSVSGFYRIHGVNYQKPQTVLMISNKETGRLLHSMIIKGIHEIKKSAISGYNEGDKESLVDGLKSVVNGKEYYNSRCDNLDGIITCKPLMKKGIELPTQFHLCSNIPSKENGYSRIESLSSEHLINYSTIPIASEITTVTGNQEGTQAIKIYDFTGDLLHSAEVKYSGDVASLVSNAEYTNSNICTYFA